MFIATGRYRVERGSSTNSFGDEVDAPRQVFESLLGSIVETTRTVYQPSESRGTRVSSLLGRFKPGTDLREGDRIIDERTYEAFTVTSVERANDLVNKGDTVVVLSVNVPDRV